MYTKNPLLLEFSPGDLVVSARGIIPHIKSALMSGKLAIQNVLKGKGKLSNRVATEFSKVMRKDPTLFGDAIRGSETARQSLSAMILQQLEPLPTADSQSVVQAIESALFTITRGQGKAIKLGKFQFNPQNAPIVARKALKNPLKSAKELVVNRATAGTYTDSSLNNYNGIISKILGLSNMPIIDGSATMVAMKSAGIGGDDLVRIAKSSKDAYIGALRNKIIKARKIYRSIINKKHQSV